MYYLLRTRRISSKFLGINVRFRETRWCRRFVASVFVCFFNDCTICWRRVVFRRRFLELMFVFGKRDVVAVLLLRFLFVFLNECIVCWGRAVFRRRFLELVFVFEKRVVVAVVLFYLLRLFVFKEKMLLEEVGLRLSERFVNF